jgi:hypothetical protein
MKNFILKHTDRVTFLIKRNPRETLILVIKDFERIYTFDIFDHRHVVLPVEIQFNNIHTVTDLKHHIELHGKEVEMFI